MVAGLKIKRNNGDPETRLLSIEPVQLVENYFAVPVERTDILKAPKHYPTPCSRYIINEITIVWDLFGGEDFTKPLVCDEEILSEGVCLADHGEVDFGHEALQAGVLFSRTRAFQSAWDAFQHPWPHNRASISREHGGKNRRRDVCIELFLAKIKFQHEIYPNHAEQASRQILVINTFEIRDKLLSSEFNKMLYLHTSPSNPKQCHANMVVLKLVHNRTSPQLNIDECSLKISVLPIRLNIDQDALLFLYNFYVNSVNIKPDQQCGEVRSPRSGSVEHRDHCLSRKNTNENECKQTESKSEVLFQTSLQNCVTGTRTASIYFKHVIISPEIPIRLDYRGKRIELTHGPLPGVLMGLAQLNCSEIRLKRVNYRHGVLGADKLLLFLLSEWSNDITKNQLPSLLGGVGPIHSFVQLFQGVRDLFWLPIEQYQKDGRIAKGIQRGANSFSSSTAMAALEITNRLVQLIQGAAEFTYDMVSPGPSVHSQRRQGRGRTKKLSPPRDIRQGVSNAYHVVRNGLGETAKTIVQVANREHEQKGVSGAFGGVLRQLPSTVVHPVILVAEATTNVLDGVRNHLEPEYRKQSEEKWKGTSN